MALAYDPEFAAAMAPMIEVFAARAQLPAGDVEGRRRYATEAFAAAKAALPAPPTVTRRDHTFYAKDGTALTIAEFRPVSAVAAASKAIFHIHGGGLIMGSVDAFEHHQMIRAEKTGLPVFAVGYRLAPENKDLVGDCFAGLEWLYEHAEEVGVDKAKIVILGESAGGGLAAGVSLMARDHGLSPPLLKQVLVFPMLDDRNITPFAEIEPFAMWKVDDNKTGWMAVLGDAAGSKDPTAVSQYAAPARATSLAGLPATYIECGQLDIFIHEDMKYATRLAEAGVPVEVHVYPGQPHGFMMFAPNTYYSKQSISNIHGAIMNA